MHRQGARSWPAIPRSHRPLPSPTKARGPQWDPEVRHPPSSLRGVSCGPGGVCTVPSSPLGAETQSTIGSYCGRLRSQTAKCVITLPSRLLGPDLPARENTDGDDRHLPWGPAGPRDWTREPRAPKRSRLCPGRPAGQSHPGNPHLSLDALTLTRQQPERHELWHRRLEGGSLQDATPTSLQEQERTWGTLGGLCFQD